MINVIPQDSHKFRNVYPEKFIDGCKDYQKELWDMEVGKVKETA